MFKITLEPKRLLDLFNKALMNGESDSAFLRFTPQDLITNVSCGTYGTYAEYQPTYFKKYTCDEQTEIKITKQFMKNLEELDIKTEPLVTTESDIPNKKLILEAGSKRWKPNLPDPQNMKSVGVPESSIPVTDVEGIGFLPTKRKETPIQFQAIVSKDILKIPNFQDVAISVLGESMKFEWNMDGHAERDIKLLTILVPKSDYKRFNFNVKFLKSLLENFVDDEITITMFEKSMFITQQLKDVNMMCFLAIKKVG